MDQEFVSLAPMEGITSFPMRLWLSLVSRPRAMTTPFFRVTGTEAGQTVPDDFAPELFELRGVLPYTLTPQFICSDPESFLRISENLSIDTAPMLELNCGCPSPNSMGRLAGSGILRDPEQFARILEKLAQTLGPQRFAVKMRLGIDSADEFPALLAGLLDLPLARLTVHGRTRVDGYRGKARWDRIQQAAATLPYPVLASGDAWGLVSLRDLKASAPQIAGTVIGRGALRNPWVFEEIRSGSSQDISTVALANALFCFALLHDLWIRHPRKLLARVANGRLAFCGTDFSAWEKLTVDLTAWLLGVPFLLMGPDSMRADALSAVAFSRLKVLWSYLRSSLPEEFAAGAILRSRRPEDFFAQFFLVAERALGKDEAIALRHQVEWDDFFARTRG